MSNTPFLLAAAESDGLRQTTTEWTIMWSAIVLLVIGPTFLVSRARTKRRLRELETIDNLAKQGFSAEEIQKVIKVGQLKETKAKFSSEQPAALAVDS